MTFVDVTVAFNAWEIPLTGVRKTGGYVSGRWVETDPETISFEGFPQNATPKDIEVLPEGIRTDESIKIHTEFDLIAQKDEDTTGDIIYYKGHKWLVVSISRRYVGKYNKAIAINKGEI